MDAKVVYSKIVTAVADGELSGSVDERLIQDAVNTATQNLFNRAFTKEDLKDLSKRGMEVDDRLLNIFRGALTTNLPYTQLNMFYGNNINGAPRKATDTITINDFNNVYRYAIGLVLPKEFMFLDSIVIEASLLDNVHVFKTYEYGNLKPDAPALSEFPIYKLDKIYEITEHEIMLMSSYNTHKHNIFKNAYKNKAILIPGESYRILNIDDYKPSILKYDPLFNFDLLPAIPELTMPQSLAFGESIYWVVTGENIQPFKIKLSYIKRPNEFVIDLVDMANSRDLNYPEEVCNIIINEAISIVLGKEFPIGDKYQIHAQNSVEQQPRE